MVGPVGLEPTTKGFLSPAVSGGSGLSLHPSVAGLGCGTLAPVIKSTRSSQVVSAPSGGAPPAWLRIAGARCDSLALARCGFPEFIPSTPRLVARGGTFFDESPALTN